MLKKAILRVSYIAWLRYQQSHTPTPHRPMLVPKRKACDVSWEEAMIWFLKVLTMSPGIAHPWELFQLIIPWL